MRFKRAQNLAVPERRGGRSKPHLSRRADRQDSE
jgi:hypothetical protein